MSKSYAKLIKARILEDLTAAKNNTYSTAAYLSWNNGVNETEGTCPVTRGFIKALIDDGHLIGSTSKGYKLMTDGKEVQQCLNSLLKRQMGISRRIQSIYDAAQSKGIL